MVWLLFLGVPLAILPAVWIPFFWTSRDLQWGALAAAALALLGGVLWRARGVRRAAGVGCLVVAMSLTLHVFAPVAGLFHLLPIYAASILLLPGITPRAHHLRRVLAALGGAHLLLIGLDLVAVRPTWGVWFWGSVPTGIPRLMGAADNPNTGSLLLASTVPLLFLAWLEWAETTAWRTAALASLGVGLALIVAWFLQPHTFGGLLALMVGLVVVLARRSCRWALIGLVVAAALLLASWHGIRAGAWADRLSNMSIALGVITANPWTVTLGAGLGTWQILSTGRPIHMDAIQAWHDLGIPGLAAYVLLLGSALRSLWRAGDTREGAAVLAAGVAWVVGSVLFFPTYHAGLGVVGIALLLLSARGSGET